MLPQSSSTRARGGYHQNRASSRGRGRGSASRGASNSSSPLSAADASNYYEKEHNDNAATRAQRGTTTMINGRGGRGGAKSVRFADTKSGESPDSNSTMKTGTQTPLPNPFSNGAKTNIASTLSTAPGNNPFAKQAAPVNSFGSNPSFGASSQPTSTSQPTKAFGSFSGASNGNANPFAAPLNPSSKLLASNPNPFSKPSGTPNGTPPASVFGGLSQPAPNNPSTGIFGNPSGISNGTTTANVFGAPVRPSSTPPGTFGSPLDTIARTTPSNTFSVSSQPASPFLAATFGKPSGKSGENPLHNPFAQPSASSLAAPSLPPSATPISQSSVSTFGLSNGGSSNPFAPAVPKPNGSSNASLNSNQSTFGNFGAKSSALKPIPDAFGFSSKPGLQTPTNTLSSSAPNGFGTNRTTKPDRNAFSNLSSQTSPTSTLGPEGSSLATAIQRAIQKDRLVAPDWPSIDPADSQDYKVAIDTYWRAERDYRSKVRASLIRAGLIDDPNHRKPLSEAIDFRGICEEMCPVFERAQRINENDVKLPEMDNGRDGRLVSAPHKFVKANARSAAGQDAPLPMDVRSPATLRRTVDYIFNNVLGNSVENIRSVHSFLWDRTRAIRRDFVFMIHSMNASEMADYAYCLERIVRFHVISLHQMSKDDNKDFTEQQEVEQLSKALLSLMDAYTHCSGLKVECPNETEFRAYYAIFNCRVPGILHQVQNWGSRLFMDSNDIEIAVSLLESLQTIWEPRGPLTPHSPTDVAQNAYAKFFSTLEEKDISYTMACFAEIHFNQARKVILKTILSSYRKQRDQTKDWTLSKLNVLLRFDDEEDIVPFGEAYGLSFDIVDGEQYLSFEKSGEVKDPFPPLKQSFSESIVERKRGICTLPQAINSNIFEESVENTKNEQEVSDEEDGLFVADNTTKAPSFFAPIPKSVIEEQDIDIPRRQEDRIAEITKPRSLFDRVTPADKMPQPQQDTSAFSSSSSEPTKPLALPSVLAQPSVASPLLLSQTSADQSPTSSPFAKASSTFFPSQPPASPISAGQQPPMKPSSFFPISSALPDEASAAAPVPGQSALPATFPAVSQTSQFLGNHQVPVPHGTSEPSVAQVEILQPQNQPLVPNKGFAFPSSDVQQTPPATFQQPSASVFSNQRPGINQLPPFQSPEPEKKPNPYDRESQLTGLSNWVATGEEGILDQFTAYTVEQILRQTVDNFLKEEARRKARDEQLSLNIEADTFRYRSLAIKYFDYWQNIAQRRRITRRGREARELRLVEAERARKSREAQPKMLIEELKKSQNSGRRGSLESLLDNTGVLDGVHDSAREIQIIVEGGSSSTGRKRSRHNTNADSQSSGESRHKRGKSDNPLRRSLLSDPSYLEGGSRIHYLTNYDPKDDSRRQISGVQTDYFRLKARGISTLPNGTPLASSVERLLRKKQSFDGISKHSGTLQQSKRTSTARSISSKGLPEFKISRTSEDRDAQLESLKKRARVVARDVTDASLKKRRASDTENEDDGLFTKRRRSAELDVELDDEDKALFERARRVREQMAEGTKWYENEIARQSGSRSVS